MKVDSGVQVTVSFTSHTVDVHSVRSVTGSMRLKIKDRIVAVFKGQAGLNIFIYSYIYIYIYCRKWGIVAAGSLF